MRSSIPTLLDEWIAAAPRRSRAVSRLLAGSGLDPAAIEAQLAVKVGQPQPLDRLPTFAPGHTRPASPMLRARLSHSGTISDATERWVGAKEMARALRTRRLQRALAGLQRDWPEALVASLKPGQLGLFASGPEDTFTLLAWQGRAKEPKLVRYSSHGERVFADLEAFLRWATR